MGIAGKKILNALFPAHFAVLEIAYVLIFVE